MAVSRIPLSLYWVCITALLTSPTHQFIVDENYQTPNNLFLSSGISKSAESESKNLYDTIQLINRSSLIVFFRRPSNGIENENSGNEKNCTEEGFNNTSATAKNSPVSDTYSSPFHHYGIINSANSDNHSFVLYNNGQFSGVEDTHPKIKNMHVLNFDTSDVNDSFTFQDIHREICANFSKSIQINNDSSAELTLFYNSSGYCTCFQSKTEKLSFSCESVSIYDISSYIPDQAESIKISNSPKPNLFRTLFPNLKKLTDLALTRNSHRYIGSKTFIGLENLNFLDLSDNYLMVFLPKLFLHTPHLKSLNVSRNEIHSLSSLSNALGQLREFENLTVDHNVHIRRILKSDLRALSNCSISLLSIFNTTISNIEEGAFSYFPSIKVLDLSANYVGEEALSNVTRDLANTSIQYLGIRLLLRLNSFPYNALKYLQNTSLYRIDISGNDFPSIHNFPSIPSLKSLRLYDCALISIDDSAFGAYSALEELDLSNNKLALYSLRSAVLDNLKILILSNQNSMPKVDFLLPDFSFANLTKLDILDLSRNKIRRKLGRYELYGLRSLTFLYLEMDQLSGFEDYAFETLSCLETLNLRGNRLTSFTDYTFWGLKNLKYLFLANNFIRFSDSANPFQYSPLLEIISLQRNNIESIPESVFNTTSKLDILMLSSNRLLPWSKRILPPNSTLRYLLLSENQISFITPIMLEEFSQVRECLDVTRNPFNCSVCSMLEFQRFLKSSNLTLEPLVKTPDVEHSLICTEPKYLRNQSFLDVEMPLPFCKDVVMESISLTSVIFIALSALIFCLFLYTTVVFSWYIRYYIFYLRCKIKRLAMEETTNGAEFIYDAFVSYNKEDNSWIKQHMVPALEDPSCLYKLCVHERDFKVGQLITENIFEAIESSKNVILVLTEDFVKSEWCMFELHMAQHRLFDDSRDCLLLIKLKEISKKNYTKNLIYLENTRVCLTWPDNNAQEQEIFWTKVKKALGTPMSNKSFVTRL